jgi:hypothetical protein
MRDCAWCGGPTSGARRTCSSRCEASAREAQDKAPFIEIGVARLRELRAAGVEPVGANARGTIAVRQRERHREAKEWNAEHMERSDPSVFRRDVLPSIQGVSLGELTRRTGLSVAYLARVRRGGGGAAPAVVGPSRRSRFA